MIINMKDMGKVYRNGKISVCALRHVNLSIDEGEFVSIMGPSGSGKSTLMNIIGCLDKSTSGYYELDGVDISKLDSKALAKVRNLKIGFVFQSFNLLPRMTALHNVELPMIYAGVGAKERKKRAIEALERVALKDRMNHKPNEMSGGQKQRVAIARALATNPKVLLCDEATSALDPTTTRSILNLLKEINQKLGITVIIITHEMSVIEEICHRVAIIDKSNIAEIGEVEEVFIRPKSKIAKQLVFSGDSHIESFEGDHMCRIIFDGRTSFEPVISNMILECRTPVNIMFADTKDIDGKAFGQMVIQLPKDEIGRKRIMNYLTVNQIPYEEVTDNVG